jgi:hypothetical protein
MPVASYILLLTFQLVVKKLSWPNTPLNYKHLTTTAPSNATTLIMVSSLPKNSGIVALFKNSA